MGALPTAGQVPNLARKFVRARNGQAWFDLFDTDDSGTLDQEELLVAFCRTFGKVEKSEVESMESILKVLSAIFDHDGNGEIDRKEFTDRGRSGNRDCLWDTILANVV